jgi:hypothetical protein
MTGTVYQATLTDQHSTCGSARIKIQERKYYIALYLPFNCTGRHRCGKNNDDTGFDLH